MEPRDYIELLRHRQLAEGWTDLRMAAELGVSESQWNFIRNRERQPGVKFLRKAMQRFPEYDYHVLLWLKGEKLPRRGGVLIARG